MTTDNQYYKQIAEKLTGETISGVHTNNYYLNKICTSLGYTYSGVTCNGTYIKDFARHFTEQTYTKIHFNNYFLKKLAEHLTGETYGNHDDNYFLGLINENIIPQPPSFTSVEVTSDKSILSYADSESAVLTAQLMNGDASASVSGETVDFYRYVDGVNDVLIDTQDTNSSGVATGTYTSAGIGDIQVYAKVRTLVSKTYDILDTKWYDNPTSTGVSKYTANGSATITYDSTNEAYSLKITSTALSTVTLDNYRFDTDVTLKADIMFTGGSNKQIGIGLLNGNVGASAKITHATNVNYYCISVIENTRTSYGSGEVEEALTSSDIVVNHWYTLEITYNGSDIVYNLYDGDTVLKSITTSKSVLSNSNELALLVGLSGNSQASFKNIRVL